MGDGDERWKLEDERWNITMGDEDGRWKTAHGAEVW